jgi:pyruvate-ferredoxin/flavodoxin oxidoreductase
MKDQIVRIVEGYWNERLPVLLARVDETARQIENFLVLEDYYRSVRSEEGQLRKTFGGFGSDQLDMKSLSSVLQRSFSSREMEKERSRRLRGIFDELRAQREAFAKSPPRPALLELKQGARKILAAFEAHIRGVTQLFKLIRIARLEAKGRYNEAEHAAYFEDFNWRQLDNAEMEVSPPFVVFTVPQEHFGEVLHEVLELVTSGRPIKVALLQSPATNGAGETGRAAALRGIPDAGLLFLSLRNLYLAQATGAGATPLEEVVRRGLRSPRPAVFSLLAGAARGSAGNAGKSTGAADAGAAEATVRAERALRSRGFPHFVYDPDRATDFVSCLELGDNPALEDFWPTATLEYRDDGGEPAQLERPFTFADFAAGEPSLAGQFKPLEPEADPAHLVGIADFLELSPGERRDKTPFVYSVNGDRHLQRLVPSQAIIARTADRLHLWHTLQELGGIHNPYVQAAESRIAERLSAEKEAALGTLQAELESRLQSRSQEAVATALRNVALRLTGMGGAAPGPLPTGQPVGPVAAAAPAVAAAQAVEAPAAAAPAPAAPAGTDPWVEAALCTSCDECTTLNKNLFAYDANKKAYLKDPRGGPYKDIVRAAEKCASGAIHPGMPLDPNEKDAEKWIKRAEKYQ